MRLPSLSVRRVLVLILAWLVPIVAATVVAPTAQASLRVVTVNTGGGAINVREGTSTQSRLLRTIPNGTRVTIVCHVRSETFSGGPYRVSTNIWNKLDSGGYVTDAMLETGSNGPVVPVCSAPAANIAAASGRPKGAVRSTNPLAAYNGYCTYGAQEKIRANTGYYVTALTGNAGDWDNQARAAGWKVVLDAEPRSVVVFEGWLAGGPGHVAWVDRVEQRSDGRYITITEMNYGTGANASNGWKTTGFGRFTSRTIKDVPGMSYILLP